MKTPKLELRGTPIQIDPQKGETYRDWETNELIKEKKKQKKN